MKYVIRTAEEILYDLKSEDPPFTIDGEVPVKMSECLRAMEEYKHQPIESQLSEGGEEHHDPTTSSFLIKAQQIEIQSLKQHNLKLRDCLGEFLKAKDIYDMVDAKANAKSLIK